MMIDWPSDLCEALARRRAVLVIGSGISRNSIGQNGKNPPTWRQFLELALARLGSTGTAHIKGAIKRGDYLTACEWLKSRLDNRWPQLLRDEFLAPAYNTSDFHRALYGLDVRIVLTPNFDKIYDSHASNESNGTVIVKTYRHPDICELLRGGLPVIVKYHGSIDSPQEMIFTRRDYHEARVKYAGFYRLFDALILTNTFLFVGCGASDPDIQFLLGQYKFEQMGAPRHYMVLPGPVNSDVKLSLRNNYNLDVLTYKAKGGAHTELLGSLNDLTSRIAQAQARMAAELSW